MDPRLQNTPPQAPRQIPVTEAAHNAPVQAAPAAVPQAPTAPAQPAQPAVPPPTYQIVGQIPLAQPSGGAPATAPQAPVAANSKPQEGDELDRILQAVNNRVQTPIQPAPKKPAQLASKLTAKAPKPKLPATTRPVGAILAVVFIFAALSACAVIAYRQGGKGAALTGKNGTVGTSYQSAASIQTSGGTLVRPADLDTYSNDLQTKLNSLNDNGDFDANSLSSSVLGL